MSIIARAHLFPIRHHSPRTSESLRRYLDQLKPTRVLVEGPSDAQGLIEVLLDEGTKPPVALLGYRTDGIPGSALFPFASYSPEYVALLWAREHGVPAFFIDLTTGQGMVADRDEGELELGEAEAWGSPSEALAKARGFRSFEELWEACFEAPDYQPDAFKALLLAWADVVREDPHRREFHRARDALMARQIEAHAEAVTPEALAVVLGAAHAAALLAGDFEPALADTLSASVPTAVTLIPYSFTRLAEQTGYGAGNRAPRFYQRAFDRGCDYRRATLEVLVEFTDHLRLRGHLASLADTIEAYRLACTLADLREKAGPGLDEVRDATVATLCRGDATHIDGFLWSSVVGQAVGQVAARIGRNALQDEFWREVTARKLPRQDAPERFALKLNDPVQVETSVFLHRLRVAEIPYAGFLGSHTGPRLGKKTEPAGGIAALGRVREQWEAQWTPSTDVALVERIVLGDTLCQVCERRLTALLDEQHSTGEAAEILAEAVVTSAPEAMARALDACEAHAATDDELPSLARACRALSGLVSFGTSREQASTGDAAVLALCVKTFARAVLRVRWAVTGTEEAVAPAREALRTLHEVALSQPKVDGEAWFEAARGLITDYTIHPTAAGLSLGLLYLAQKVDEAEVALMVTQRLSTLLEPEKAALFLVGFFEVNALVLVKNRAVVKALDAFLVGIDPERFRDALPMLRRAFGHLGATERRYLLENLLGLRAITGSASEVAQIVAERDKEALKSLSADMAKVMDDLDDLL